MFEKNGKNKIGLLKSLKDNLERHVAELMYAGVKNDDETNTTKPVRTLGATQVAAHRYLCAIGQETQNKGGTARAVA